MSVCVVYHTNLKGTQPYHLDMLYVSHYSCHMQIQPMYLKNLYNSSIILTSMHDCHPYRAPNHLHFVCTRLHSHQNQR